MRSLGELADNYERWAEENDAVAFSILSNVSTGPEHVRDEQLLQVSLLTDEAESFRYHAARLRASTVERIPMWLGLQARPC